MTSWLVGLDVDGTIILQDESRSPGVPEAVARLRDAGGGAGDAAAAGDVADEHRVERRGGLAGLAQVVGGGAQVVAHERDREVEVLDGVEDVGPGGWWR